MSAEGESLLTDHPIFRVYEGLDQLGPGDDACTERALRLVDSVLRAIAGTPGPH